MKRKRRWSFRFMHQKEDNEVEEDDERIFLENLFEDGILKIKFGILEFFENLFEDDILRIKFGILGFWKIWKMVVLENYSTNGISEN